MKMVRCTKGGDSYIFSLDGFVPYEFVSWEDLVHEFYSRRYKISLYTYMVVGYEMLMIYRRSYWKESRFCRYTLEDYDESALD